MSGQNLSHHGRNRPFIRNLRQPLGLHNLGRPLPRHKHLRQHLFGRVVADSLLAHQGQQFHQLAGGDFHLLNAHLMLIHQAKQVVDEPVGHTLRLAAIGHGRLKPVGHGQLFRYYPRIHIREAKGGFVTADFGHR